MARDERFPPNRDRSKDEGIKSTESHLTIKASGPRRRIEGETSTRGREHGHRLQGIVGPVIEIEQFSAERDNLPPKPEQPIPWDEGMHGGYSYSDDDRRAAGIDRDGNAL